jgi:cyclophilin family peptidyl-prolyl cis-trans isomerase/protein-disulfide isomerase
MSKKILLTLLIGMFVIAACTSNTPEPTATQEPDPTEVITEEPTEPAVETDPFEGERMPCTTVFDYETTAEIDQYQAVVDQAEPVTDEDWIYGDPNAPITIIEYEDFQCPACPGFSLSVKSLIEDFPSIRVVFRHLPLPSIHDKAYISSMAAEAAGAQGKFWEMHDVLYTLQSEWSGMTEDDFVDWVTGKAEELELDLDQFELDLFDEEKRAELEAITEQRLSAGFNYTPFVVVNDRIYRNGNPNIFSLVGIYEFDGYEECPPWVIEPEKSYSAVIDTSAGEIEVELFADVAPLAVNNFVFLAQEGWFDEVYFHRVVEGFVAQAGDPSGLGVVGPGYSFVNETDNDLVYDAAGYLAMANSGVDRNGSQFFITLAPTPDLNGGYTIFGKVMEDSMALIQEIALRDPNTAVDFEDATIINGVEIIEN